MAKEGKRASLTEHSQHDRKTDSKNTKKDITQTKGTATDCTERPLCSAVTEIRGYAETIPDHRPGSSKEPSHSVCLQTSNRTEI